MASWGGTGWNQSRWGQAGSGPPPGLPLGALQNRVSQRLDEGLIGATYYTLAEITARINEGYRFFVLLTLGLETTAVVPLAAATTFYHMLSAYPDWILPLRVYSSAGAKIRPATLAELDSLDSGWTNSPGAPLRYIARGFDLFGIYPQPAAPGTNVIVTYAQAPADLVNAGDVPLIPPEYQLSLVDYAIYALRQKEGGQEFLKTLPYFDRFLSDAQEYGEYVRTRNLGNRYEATPFELSLFDRSRLGIDRAKTPARRTA